MVGLVALALPPLVAQKVEIETNVDKTADFSTIKTYAWLPPPPVIQNVAPGAASNPNLTQEVLGPHIVEAVNRQLRARGLTETDRDSADVLIAYGAALTTGFSRTYLGEHYGYVTGWGSPIPLGLAPTTSGHVYEQGTVVVDVVQRASNRAIWRGSAVTRVQHGRTVEERVERINDAAKRMFDRFPIRARK
jgi:hypothetical protein